MKEIIGEAFGEITGLFMSQGDTRSGDIVMPTEDLERILDDTIKRLNNLK